MDRPRDSIAAVVRSRHGPGGGAKFTTGRAPQIVRRHSWGASLTLAQFEGKGLNLNKFMREAKSMPDLCWWIVSVPSSFVWLTAADAAWANRLGASSLTS